MKKVLIGIKDCALTISYRKVPLKTDNNLLNTNVITDNELIFSDEYINNNKKIVISFVRELIAQYNIKQLIIKESELAELAIDLINNSESVRAIFFREEKQLSYEICEKVLTNHNIKIVNCYSMPPFMIECFDKKGIKTESRSEIMFTSPFMQSNNLLQYSKIFYKMSVRIELPLKDSNLDDFKIFCKINKYLKAIHLNKYNKSEIEKIIEILKEEKIKNVKIYVHDDISKEADFATIKKINFKNKKHHIKLTLKYTDDYLKNNIFKQIVVNVLKICGIVTLFLVVSFLSYVGLSNYHAQKKDKQIKKEIATTIEKTDTEELVNKLNEDIPENEPKIDTGYVASVLSINPETKGWIKINDTNIDYPVVQAKNNKYYLKHNFNLESDNNGWVFMDYRNSTKDLDKNTIIYAHNRYYNGVMFGTLDKVLNNNWNSKKENLTFTFDTLYDEYKWEIFSVYKIHASSDYLQVNFTSDDEWLEFVHMLKERSYRNYDVNVGVEDKIVTLSTCATEKDTRLVVHAVLKK
ncbi:MAG: class B sortase [Bacilli bacterium]|nr:class B sortase [Bacilli bacterium]